MDDSGSGKARDDDRMLLLYLRAHHGRAVLVGFLIVAAIDVMLGSTVLTLPSLGGKSTGFPLRHHLPIGFVAVAVGSLASQMAGPEETAGAIHRRWEQWHAAAASALCVGTVTATEFVATGERTALMMMRATVFWLGLAFLSGRLLGRKHAWIGPVASIFPASYLAQDASGYDAWWDWIGQRPDSASCAALAAGVFVTGVVAYELTPWRLAGLRWRAPRRTTMGTEAEYATRFSAASLDSEPEHAPSTDPSQSMPDTGSL